MTNSQKISALLKTRSELQKKVEELIVWLVNNTKNEYFTKVASDRNHYKRKIAVIDFKIEQLNMGKPILGEPDFFIDIQALDQETKRKSQL